MKSRKLWAALAAAGIIGGSGFMAYQVSYAGIPAHVELNNKTVPLFNNPPGAPMQTAVVGGPNFAAIVKQFGATVVHHLVMGLGLETAGLHLHAWRGTSHFHGAVEQPGDFGVEGGNIAALAHGNEHGNRTVGRDIGMCRGFELHHTSRLDAAVRQRCLRQREWRRHEASRAQQRGGNLPPQARPTPGRVGNTRA